MYFLVAAMARVRAKGKASRRKGMQWTSSEISLFKKKYPETETEKLAKKLGRSIEAVRFMAKKCRLKKTRAYMEALYDKARKSAPKRKSLKKR